MGFGSRAILAGGLGFAAAFAVACGSSNGLLSSGQSSTLAGDLNSISSAVASGQCARAQQAATTLNNDVAALRSVTSTLLQNLAQGAGTVGQLATTDCHASGSSSSSSSSSTSSSTSSVPVTTTTTTTTITPSSTSSTSSSSTAGGGGTATGGGSPGTSTSANGGAGIGGAGGTGTGNGQ